MFCKTIILSNSENLTTNAPKGILTLSKESNCIKGKIRLYNIATLPQYTKIGLYINEKVHISNLIKRTNHYEFDIQENIDITQSIYCALIDNSNNKKVLLEGGSFNGFYFTDSPFDAILEAKDEQLEQTIDNALKNIDNCENCNCENCEYKKYFYENYDNKENLIIDNTSLDENLSQTELVNKITNEKDDYIENLQANVISNLNNKLDQEVNDLTQTLTNDINMNSSDNNTAKDTLSSGDDKIKEKLEFLNDIIYQLDEILKQYPEDELLNSIIENSRFVKVDGDNPYVVGVIYEDKMLKYIAYGVPAQYNTLPPKDLGQHYQWLPLNPNDVMSDGYFMIYQDATNGNIVEINFE